MEKYQAIFIGGSHGTGKTSLCRYLNLILKGTIVKQRHLIMDIKKNTDWNEVAPFHNELIEEAGMLAIEKLKNNKQKYLFIDCHYGIKKDKALRSYLSLSSKFIPDLDKRFVESISKFCILKFILLKTTPEVALNRLKYRFENLSEYNITLEELNEINFYEDYFFNQFISEFNINGDNFKILKNNFDFKKSLTELFGFITNLDRNSNNV